MKQTVYRLNYEQEYHCKCAACRRTCCRNDWDIDLTEAEYERDRSLCRQLALDEQKVFEKKPEGARLKFDGQGLCPFLSQEGLCSLRLESGRCSGAVCDHAGLNVGICKGKRVARIDS